MRFCIKGRPCGKTIRQGRCFWMNPYLIAFSVYALLITPVTLHASVRLGTQVRYRLRVQAAGLPFMRRTYGEEREKERTVREEDVTRTLSEPWIWPVLRAVGVRGLLRLARVLRLESVYFHVRVSFDDAAATAMCYATLETLLRALACLGALPRSVEGRVEMDFQARGTEVFTSGIISARLGSLGIAAIRLGAALVKSRARQNRTEEETYAAASH